jgi:hypothetical protein
MKSSRTRPVRICRIGETAITARTVDVHSLSGFFGIEFCSKDL